jgi:preprotein translocase subunit SecY
MSFYKNLILSLPEVKNPIKKLSLKQKLLWTLGILVLYLFLTDIPVFGITEAQITYFQQMELLLGAKIGKLLTLGIGPIVTSSIVLQLLKGAGILNFDITTEKGKFYYTGTHKLLTFAFIILEAFIYVAFGAVQPASHNLFWLVVLQLALGGFLVYYMDEVVKKWGIGSGVSLFIAAGIGRAVFLKLFSPFTQTGGFGWPFFGTDVTVGKLWAGLYYLSHAQINDFVSSVLGPVGITILLFMVIVYLQSINVEIPLSFGRVRGQSIKWPLNFFYAGVIPIILITALSANFKLWAMVWEKLRGMEQGSSLVSTIVSYLQPVNLWTNLGNLTNPDVYIHFLIYLIYMILGATLFSYFWIQSSGMDPKSVAKQILKSGLQIPGFRKDSKIIERVLKRYIPPLTIMGGIGIGILAAFANLLGALTTGTGILLMIMIIYQFYRQLAQESMEDLTLLKKLFRK